MSSRSPGSSVLALAALLGVAAVTIVPARAADPLPLPGQWDFAVTLDDRPIGRHRFRLSAAGAVGDGPGNWQLSSEADYEVRLLGLLVYRYTHRAREQWQGGCLSALTATTDDDGTKTEVGAQRDARGLQVQIVAARGTRHESVLVPGCAMSFAYWNPDIRRQTRLLNPQTGRLEPVTVTLAGRATLTVRGRNVDAEDWRIAAPDGPIDVWYDAAGAWVGLDATVSGQRHLRYRLR